MKHGHDIHLHIVYGCFLATEIELNYNRDSMICKAPNIYHLDLSRKVYRAPLSDNLEKIDILTILSHSTQEQGISLYLCLPFISYILDFSVLHMLIKILVHYVHIYVLLVNDLFFSYNIFFLFLLRVMLAS